MDYRQKDTIWETSLCKVNQVVNVFLMKRINTLCGKIIIQTQFERSETCGDVRDDQIEGEGIRGLEVTETWSSSVGHER